MNIKIYLKTTPGGVYILGDAGFLPPTVIDLYYFLSAAFTLKTLRPSRVGTPLKSNFRTNAIRTRKFFTFFGMHLFRNELRSSTNTFFVL